MDSPDTRGFTNLIIIATLTHIRGVTAMPQCFVIQPFDDNGPYDKRYLDVLEPAIRAAGLEPYRVDRDPSVAVPIDDIEKGIRDSDICLADISPDNPNVWYEVGFAFAHGKPVVLICAKQRPTEPPFDIQHRKITFYSQDSPSDFEKLNTAVASRLEAQLKKSEAMQTIASLSPVKATEGLSSYEIAALVSIMENRVTSPGGITPKEVQNDMRKAGYTDLATSLSLESLKRKDMVEFALGRDYDGDPYNIVRLADRGLDWMLANQDRFKLSLKGKTTPEEPEISDEDIPF